MRRLLAACGIVARGRRRMSAYHCGGCVCGAIRVRCRGKPLRVTVCHCTWCQRRTGTAFGTEVVFTREAAELRGPSLTSYRHVSDESGRWLEIRFCGACGTNMGFTLEATAELQTVPAGVFDDPGWIADEGLAFRHVYVRSKRTWGELTPRVEAFEQHFRE